MSLVYFPYKSNSMKLIYLPYENNFYNPLDLPPYLPQLAQSANESIKKAHDEFDKKLIPINNMEMKSLPNLPYNNPLLNEVQNQ